jgi:hypothetical protein
LYILACLKKSHHTALTTDHCPPWRDDLPRRSPSEAGSSLPAVLSTVLSTVAVSAKVEAVVAKVEAVVAKVGAVVAKVGAKPAALHELL